MDDTGGSNKALEAFVGITREELVGKTVFDLTSPELADFYQLKDKELLESGEVQQYEAQVKDIHGRLRDVILNKAVFTDRQGAVGGLIGTALDITERNETERTLRENKAQLDLALKSARMGAWHWNIIENKRYFDDQVCHLLGIDPAMFTGRGEEFFQVVHPDDRDAVRAALAQTIEQDVPYETDYRAVWLDGSIHHITARGRLVRDNTGRPVRINGIIWDITARKIAEESLKTSLGEKDALLKEIHHRVKNNLQIISSLLNMQSHHISDPEGIDVFKTSMDRIRSMALIHERLYGSKNLASIQFPGYVNDLVQGLLATYSVGRKVNLNLHVEPISFNVDNAIPLGLIINELVSNALKHAFSEGTEGVITVSLHMKGKNAVLVVSDNGKGFPADVDFTDTQSLGMQLVVTLVEQLDGAIELKRDKGTEFRIAFEAVAMR